MKDGDVPEGWKKLTTEDFGGIVTGNTPSKSIDDNYGEKYSWATAKDFIGKYVSNTVIKLSERGSNKVQLVPKGSVLVTCIASIGKNAIAAEQLATNQQINAIIVSSDHSNEFVTGK